MLKIRRSHDRLIFHMGIAIRGKDGLYIETGPWALRPHFSPMNVDIRVPIHRANSRRAGADPPFRRRGGGPPTTQPAMSDGLQQVHPSLSSPFRQAVSSGRLWIQQAYRAL